MCALTCWHAIPCVALISALTPDPDLIFKIVAASASDPWIQKKASQLMDEEGGYFTLHGLIVVPESMQTEVIRLHHDSPTAGHMGESKTMDLIQRQFWWSKMESVHMYVQRCDSCQRNKSLRTTPFGSLQPIQIPDTRWSVVTMDFVTGLPVSRQGNDCILVMVDKLTKYEVVVPCLKTLTAAQCADLFIQHIFQTKGLPDKIISDRDKLFTST